jgi:hypothetical protein
MIQYFAPCRAGIQASPCWTRAGIPREFDDPAEGEWMSVRRVSQPHGC